MYFTLTVKSYKTWLKKCFFFLELHTFIYLPGISHAQIFETGFPAGFLSWTRASHRHSYRNEQATCDRAL